MTPLRLVPMRRDSDCGVAAFATLLGLPYEDAAEVITQTNGKLGKGLYLTSLQRAAKALSKKLLQRKRFDLDEAEGILWVDGGSRMQHFVVLTEGRIYDPADNTLWDALDYFTATTSKPRTLLALIA